MGVDDAVDWYEPQTGSGAAFMACVRAVLEGIERFPEAHAAVYEDIPRAVVRRPS